MSTPHGHPDYQGYPLWRGPLIQAGNFSVTSVLGAQYQGYVTNFASLNLQIQMATGTGVTVNVALYTDASQTVFEGGFEFTINAVGTIMNVVFPCVGNYAVVFVGTSQAGTQTGRVIVAPCNTPVSRPQYQSTQNALDGNGVNINSGASLTALLPFIVEGEGKVFVQCSNATALFTVEVDELTEGGAIFGTPFRVASVAGPQSGLYDVDAHTVQLKITNNDAAAHTYSYHCQVLNS